MPWYPGKRCLWEKVSRVFYVVRPRWPAAVINPLFHYSCSCEELDPSKLMRLWIMCHSNPLCLIRKIHQTASCSVARIRISFYLGVLTFTVIADLSGR